MKVNELKITDLNNKTIDVKSNKNTKRAIKIEWITSNNKFILEANPALGQVLLPYFSPSHEELIVFFLGFKEYDLPNNVAIFNSDGKVISHLKIPKLISKEYIEFENRKGVQEAQKSLKFLWPATIIEDGKDVLVMCIRFNYDWFEIRELNPETGEFGKCFGATKQ